MNKSTLQIPFKLLIVSLLFVFSSFVATSQVNQVNTEIAIPEHKLNPGLKMIKNSVDNNFHENLSLLNENENSAEPDSFVYEVYDKNLSKWIRTAKYKNGIIQNSSDTVWYIAIWIDSTKTWKEYPNTSVFYENGRLIKKELFENLVGDYILVYKKTELNISYNNEGKTEITTKCNYDYFKEGLVNSTKTEATYDKKDSIVAKSLFLWDTYYNQWIESRKDTFEFDDYGNKTNAVSYLWNSELEKWNGYNKTTKEYDKENEVLKETSYSWDSSAQSWLNLTKTEFTKGDNGEIISTFLIWDNALSDWRNSARKIINHDNNGLQILQINSNWDFITSQWKNIYKLEDKYDNDSNQVLRSSYNWDDNNNRWRGEKKIEKEFNSVKKELSKTEFLWNDSIGNWVNNIKEIFKYDQYGNLELNEILKWNMIIQEWQFDSGRSKSNYKYNETGKVTEQVYFVWNSENNDWQYATKYVYNRDTQNRLILQIKSIWNIQRKEWIKMEKWNSAFDSESRNIHNSSSIWDEERNDWKIININETVWDKNGNFTLNTFLFWSEYSNDYQGGKKEQGFNESGQILWKTSYTWDSNLEQWKAESKTTQSYTQEGLMDTISYFNWDIALNEMVGISRIIYFYSGTVDINEISNVSEIKLYPNPAANFVTTEITKGNCESLFELFDLTGKLLMQKPIIESSQIELQVFKNGIYPWKITSKGKKYSGKLVIKK